MSRKAFCALLLSIAAFGCAAPAGPGATPKEVVVDRGAAGSTVALRRGQLLTIRLVGNPTTGYQWERVAGGEPVLTPQGEPRYLPESGRVGAGGTYSFTFLATGSGSAELSFVYRRSFGHAAPGETVRFSVTVTE